MEHVRHRLTKILPKNRTLLIVYKINTKGVKLSPSYHRRSAPISCCPSVIGCRWSCVVHQSCTVRHWPCVIGHALCAVASLVVRRPLLTVCHWLSIIPLLIACCPSLVICCPSLVVRPSLSVGHSLLSSAVGCHWSSSPVVVGRRWSAIAPHHRRGSSAQGAAPDGQSVARAIPSTGPPEKKKKVSAVLDTRSTQ